MKVLVATAATQGRRASDVMRCVDGELVRLVEACNVSRRRPHGPCDCGITFRGLTSDEKTTTARVVERDEVDLEWLTDALEATHRFERSAAGCTCPVDPVAEAWSLAALAGLLPVGVVVERVVDRLVVRPGG